MNFSKTRWVAGLSSHSEVNTGEPEVEHKAQNIFYCNSKTTARLTGCNITTPLWSLMCKFPIGSHIKQHHLITPGMLRNECSPPDSAWSEPTMLIPDYKTPGCCIGCITCNQGFTSSRLTLTVAGLLLDRRGTAARHEHPPPPPCLDAGVSQETQHRDGHVPRTWPGWACHKNSLRTW